MSINFRNQGFFGVFSIFSKLLGNHVRGFTILFMNFPANELSYLGLIKNISFKHEALFLIHPTIFIFLQFFAVRVRFSSESHEFIRFVTLNLKV